ncbi:uncharacterized protein LOC143423816 [Xylocopa sonorina]|uniref:uncharacterized protein LOC143423816 n=1 Tax=Xylocopa sonorina TaxID=1818115 RepID=UPI00403ABBA6
MTKRTQESKRGCCASTFSPISTTIDNQPQSNRYQRTITTPINCCSLRRCKYAKSQIQSELFSTQRLLDKIQCLKKSIQELETAQRQFQPDIVEKKDVDCQTQGSQPSDLYSIREVVDNCIAEMTKLKAFLDDDNCWWKIFKKREFSCCDQKLPHLHGFLDGTMVTLKMLEERLDLGKNIVTSTPMKPSSLHCLNSEPADERNRYIELKSEDTAEHRKKYVDCSINTGRGNEFSVKKTDPSCQDQCPKSCTVDATIQNASTSEDSKATRQDAEVDQRRESNELERPQQIETTDELDSATNDKMKLSSGWHLAKSSTNFGDKTKPSVTFISENLARRTVIEADRSTSMDLLPNVEYQTMAPSVMKNIVERNFSMSQKRSFVKSKKLNIKRNIHQAAGE